MLYRAFLPSSVLSQCYLNLVMVEYLQHINHQLLPLSGFCLFSGLVIKHLPELHWCTWSWINREDSASLEGFKFTNINITPHLHFHRGTAWPSMHTCRPGRQTHSLLKLLGPLVSGDVGLSWNGSSEAALPDSEWKMGMNEKWEGSRWGVGWWRNGQKRERDSV